MDMDYRLRISSKPVLLGMNSPQSADPEKALWPWNYACTGGRLLKMMQDEFERPSNGGGYYFAPEWFVGGFERINVLNKTKWDRGLARAAAPLVYERLIGRVVVVCGLEVQRVMDFQLLPWLKWNSYRDEVRYCMIPHPSGLTRWYNNEENRRSVGKLLLGLYGEWISSQSPPYEAKPM